MNRLLILAALCAMLTQVATAQDNDQRMKWWREARFGMFIHWGLYAVPAGEWGERKDHGEWIMETAQIPVEEYEKLKAKFNPVKFDAKDWARMAKDAGMKYVVITSKHHDGFDLFESKTSDYDVMATPFKRDIMKELSDAVRGEGLTMCWYHSIMDWHHPDYRPARKWNSRQAETGPVKEHMDRYNEYLRSQVTELLKNYGPIGVMWFDGEWESTWNDGYGKPLYDLCREIQPNVIVNNRVSNSRSGSMEDAGPSGVGDFSTPEQYIPPTGLPGVDWETCMTMNANWGWNKADQNWKPTKLLIQNLCDVVSKGGNYLLNIGPRPDGTFPYEAVVRLKEIGDWMDDNSESIYGTNASVFEALPWGRSTTKKTATGTDLFFHIFEWPQDNKLVIPGLGSDPKSVALLSGNKALQFERVGSDIVATLPADAADRETPVVRVSIEGAPIVYRSPKINSPSDILVESMQVSIESGSPELQVHFTLDGSDPTEQSPTYSSPINITETKTVKAATFHKGKRVSQVTTYELKKVEPQPAAEVQSVAPGLLCTEYRGDWNVLPDFTTLEPLTRANSGKIEPAPGSEEYVGRNYEGFLKIPSAGVYTFALTSDDGSKMWLDGSVLIDNDGLHGTVTVTGRAALAAGWHRLRLGWFNKSGAASLQLSWAKAGDKMKLVEDEELGHTATSQR